MTVLGYTRHERVIGYAWLAGLALSVIGLRFLLWPASAAMTFGLSGEIGGEGADFGLHYVIGLRDIWLGFLLIIFAWRRSMTPLGLWFLLGAGVCIGDAAIVSGFSGPWPAIAFHLVSGAFCGFAGLAALAEARPI